MQRWIVEIVIHYFNDFFTSMTISEIIPIYTLVNYSIPNRRKNVIGNRCDKFVPPSFLGFEPSGSKNCYTRSPLQVCFLMQPSGIRYNHNCMF